MYKIQSTTVDFIEEWTEQNLVMGKKRWEEVQFGNKGRDMG